MGSSVEETDAYLKRSNSCPSLTVSSVTYSMFSDPKCFTHIVYRYFDLISLLCFVVYKKHKASALCSAV